MGVQKEYAERWEESSKFFYFNGYYRWMEEALKRYQTILEIGCGSGYSTLSLAELGHNVLSVDKNQNCIDMAYKRIREKGFEKDIAFLEIDVSAPNVVEELANKFPFDAVACWDMGSYYDVNELRDVYVPRMQEYGLSVEQIKENISSSYCELIIWNACKLAAEKRCPIQIVDRNEGPISFNSDGYYRSLKDEFRYKNIEYRNLAGETLSGEGVRLLKKGIIQEEAKIPIFFNSVLLFDSLVS